eukprot:1493608-Alexandrium_andersonii.AAC.1
MRLCMRLRHTGCVCPRKKCECSGFPSVATPAEGSLRRVARRTTLCSSPAQVLSLLAAPCRTSS